LNEVGRTPLWGELLPEDLADVGENDDDPFARNNLRIKSASNQVSQQSS
jgi:hypothetical protein